MTSINPFEEEPGLPLEYKLFALCFREEGAVEFFNENLDPSNVGVIHGETGLHEFYKAILDFYIQTKIDPVDPIAFRSWLEETEIFSALGGEAGVRVFIDTITEAELPDRNSVLKILQIRANRRKQLNTVQDLQQLLSKKETKSDYELEKITELTEKIRDLEKELDFNPLDYVTTTASMIKNVEAIIDIPDFIPTQFKSLNRAMGYSDEGGFYRGAVHAVLAASGLGKSTFCKSLCVYWLNEGYTVLFINFEEVRNHWERILFTQIVGRNLYEEGSSWSPGEREMYAKIYREKLESWGSRLMVRHDMDTPYFDDLELWFRDVMGHNEIMPDIVVIDTIQSMFTKGSNKPRWGEFEQMMVRLEKLARDMDSVMIITAQQNSNAIKEKRAVLNQADTGGSIVIQQKSAITMFLTSINEEDESADNPAEVLMQLQIPKNRITGAVFNMNPPMVKYIDKSKSYVPYDLPDDYGTGKVYGNDLSQGIENL